MLVVVGAVAFKGGVGTGVGIVFGVGVVFGIGVSLVVVFVVDHVSLGRGKG